MITGARHEWGIWGGDEKGSRGGGSRGPAFLRVGGDCERDITPAPVYMIIADTACSNTASPAQDSSSTFHPLLCRIQGGASLQTSPYHALSCSLRPKLRILSLFVVGVSLAAEYPRPTSV